MKIMKNNKNCFRDLCVLTKEDLELAQNTKYDFTISEEEFNAAFFDKIIEDLSKSEVFEDLEFREQIAIISDDAIEYINKKEKKHKISNKYKNTKLF